MQLLQKRSHGRVRRDVLYSTRQCHYHTAWVEHFIPDGSALSTLIPDVCERLMAHEASAAMLWDCEEDRWNSKPCTWMAPASMCFEGRIARLPCLRGRRVYYPSDLGDSDGSCRVRCVRFGSLLCLFLLASMTQRRGMDDLVSVTISGPAKRQKRGLGLGQLKRACRLGCGCS